MQALDAPITLEARQGRIERMATPNVFSSISGEHYQWAGSQVNAPTYLYRFGFIAR